MRKHRHLGSYGIIINNGKILLVKKGRGAYTGKLDLPGGGFEHPETPEECVTREIKEETGLTVKSLKLSDALSVNVQWNDLDDVEDLHHIGIIYKVRYEKSSIKTDPDGLDSLGSAWYDISKLSGSDVSPFVLIMLRKLKYDIK